MSKRIYSVLFATIFFLLSFITAGTSHSMEYYECQKTLSISDTKGAIEKYLGDEIISYEPSRGICIMSSKDKCMFRFLDTMEANDSLVGFTRLSWDKNSTVTITLDKLSKEYSVTINNPKDNVRHAWFGECKTIDEPKFIIIRFTTYDNKKVDYKSSETPHSKRYCKRFLNEYQRVFEILNKKYKGKIKSGKCILKGY